MIAVCVTFTIKAGQMDQFMPLMHKQADTSLRAEPGCHRFDICTGTGDDVFLYELYTDRPAFEVHMASDHFKSFDAQVTDMVAEKAVVIHEQVREAS